MPPAKKAPTALERINLSRKQKGMSPLKAVDFLGGKRYRLWIFGYQTRKGRGIVEQFNAMRERQGLPPLTYGEIRETKLKEMARLRKELTHGLSKATKERLIKETGKIRRTVAMRDYIKRPEVIDHKKKYARGKYKEIKKDKKLYDKLIRKQREYSRKNVKTRRAQEKIRIKKLFTEWNETDDFLNSINITRENTAYTTYIGLKNCWKRVKKNYLELRKEFGFFKLGEYFNKRDLQVPLTEERLKLIRERHKKIKERIEGQKKLMKMKADYSVLARLKEKTLEEVSKEDLTQLVLIAFQERKKKKSKAKELLARLYEPKIRQIASGILGNRPLKEKIPEGHKGLMDALMKLQSLENVGGFFYFRIRGAIIDYFKGEKSYEGRMKPEKEEK